MLVNFLRYQFWPAAKVRITYWWWIIKYGGKKNIPPELIFSRMAGSMARMNESLMNALRVIPPDTSEEEKRELLELIEKASSFENEVKEITSRRE